MKAKVLFTAPIKMNPFSWLIIKIQKFGASHAMIVFEDMGVEATFSGVVCKSIDNIMYNREVIKCVEVELTKESLRYAKSKMGCKYGFKALLGYTLQTIFRLNHNPLGDKEKTFVCSEFAARVLAKSCYTFPKSFDALTVKDVYEAIK